MFSKRNRETVPTGNMMSAMRVPCMQSASLLKKTNEFLLHNEKRLIRKGCFGTKFTRGHQKERQATRILTHSWPLFDPTIDAVPIT